MLMMWIKTFVVGGLICLPAQLLLDHTKLMPGRIMSLHVVAGCVLGALGLYQPLIDFAGCGASVPLPGFGNTLWKGVAEKLAEEGLLGVFQGGLTAASAGICAALVFGLISSLIFSPKMKKSGKS